MNSSTVKCSQSRQVIGRGQPEGTVQALIGVLAVPTYNGSTAPANRQCLAACFLTGDLNKVIICPSIFCDDLAHMVNDLMFTSGSLEFLSQVLRFLMCIDQC